MFSIGFAELLLIAVVTLLIVGPEKLPETVRAITIQLSKIKRFWQNAKREVEREVGMDEIRREIHNTQVMEHLERAKKMNFQQMEEFGDTGLEKGASKEDKIEEPKPEPAADDSREPAPDTDNNTIHERRPEPDAD
jgi:sec-independent protein translocase protein TatB